MHEIKDYNTQLDDLSKKLSFDTIDSTQSTLNNMLIALNTLDQTNAKNKKNVDELKIKMINLQKKILTTQQQLQLKNNPMLVEQMN